MEILVENIVALVLIGFITGTLTGFLSSGGGPIVVLLLTFILPRMHVDYALSMHMAVGTALAIGVPGTGLAAWGRWKAGDLDLKYLRTLFFGIFIGVLLGIFIAHFADMTIMKWIFIIFAVLTAIYVPFHEKWTMAKHPPKGFSGGFLGFATSAVSTIVGEGVGAILMPILIGCGYPMHGSIGLGAATNCIGLFIGTVGFILIGWGATNWDHWQFGYINLIAFICVEIPLLFAVPWGIRLSKRIPRGFLKLAFAFVMFLVGILMLLQVLDVL